VKHSINIKESLVYIKKQKLAIILKELLHLKYILNYYSPNSTEQKDDKTKSEQNNQEIVDLNKLLKKLFSLFKQDIYTDQHYTGIKEDMSTANRSLEAIERSLEELYDYIDFLNAKIDISENQEKNDDIYFIILHDLIGRRINNALYIIELIYKKVYQIFEESYNQYIPKPKLGRRFSNNNLVSSLKYNYQYLISQLTPKNKKFSELILSWSYRNYVHLEYKHDEFTNSNSNRYGNYINLPYWYYEIPTLLPSITHEAIRIVLLQEDNELLQYKKNITKDVNNYLAKPRSDISFTIEEDILQDKYSLTNKVLADITAFAIYGNSYIYSLFHDTIGLGLSQLFRLNISGKKLDIYKDDDTSIDNNKTLHDILTSNFDYKISSYKLERLRDLTIIRLHILLHFANNNNETISQMTNLLSSILDRKETSRDYGLAEIYKNYPHYTSSFNIHAKAMKNIINLYINAINSTDILPKINKRFKNNIPINFNPLWKKYLHEGSLHRNEFRKLLHKKTLSILKKDIQEHDNNLNINELGSPYAMKFIKIHKSYDCNKDSENCLDKVIRNTFKENTLYHSFGIYDLFININTENYHKEIDDTIRKKLNKIKELTEKVDLHLCKYTQL